MQRYFAEDKQNDFFIVNEDDEYQIKKVLRYKKNTQIEIVFKQKLYLAELVNLNPLQIKKLNQLEEELELLNVTLYIPFLKENKMSFLLQKATELGVDKIGIYQADRSMIKIADNSFKKLKRYQKICKEASEQSKRLTIPLVEFVNEETLIVESGPKFICLPEAKNNIKIHLKKLDDYDNIKLLIGPEGGFSPREEELYLTNDFLPINLGTRILRTETVPLFLLSSINYQKME